MSFRTKKGDMEASGTPHDKNTVDAGSSCRFKKRYGKYTEGKSNSSY